ncbi:hypothetical protein G7Y89_g5213 [Cudoniella acicularis]|uniref:NAD(P)-binding domain-containing protein n=1 Tax=Cudoniella acicularis TaxID=354080 RepID=A0A8H4W6Q0_9HELO|nr:hypothetical protein G7Y89_g5213 [Cudoniella acicularis]
MSRILLISSNTHLSKDILSALLQLPDTLIAQIFIAAKDVPTARKAIPSNPLLTFLKDSGPHSILARTGPIDALFYLTPNGSSLPQSRELIDVALAQGVPHFVLASIDHGSTAELTGIRPLDVPSQTEQYLKSQSEGTGTSWTILQRAQWMDNISDEFMDDVFATLWAGLPKGKKMQLIRGSGGMRWWVWLGMN